MKKIFIDCGGNKGQSVRRFIKSNRYSEDFEIYSFEPLEVVSKRYSSMENVCFFQKAVWIYDGEIDFFVDTGRKYRYEGSTIISSKKSRTLNKKEPIKVGCIDFSKWVKGVFSKDDYIILKMDIEGAEYEVLNKMIKDGTIEYINDLYIEWHWHKIRKPEEEHLEFMDTLKSIKTLNILPEMNKVL